MKKSLDEFFIGLQFLTRISIVKQTIWTEENFGGSVKFFPMIGAVLGVISSSIALIFLSLEIPQNLSAAILSILPIILTGGIHADGFMDTCDGILSGREKDRALEIMKDSRAGSMAVASFVCISILNFAITLDLQSQPHMLIVAFFSTPIISRAMMVATIGLFPYARPSGMGFAFAKYTTRKTIALAIFQMIALTIPVAIFFPRGLLIAMISSAIFTWRFGIYSTQKLGGVTGDVYGLVTVMVESICLASFLIGG